MSRITGIAKLRKDAEIFRGGFGDIVAKEVQDSLEAPIKKFKEDVIAAAKAKFPTRYAGVYGASFQLRVGQLSRGRSAIRVKLTGTARGRAEIRDSASLNRGRLRHKTWGRHPWHDQSVSPGFWDDPAKVLANNVRKAVEDAVQRASTVTEKEL